VAIKEAGRYKAAKEVIKALALRVILLFLLKNAHIKSNPLVDSRSFI
jgi:hypothetical protein